MVARMTMDPGTPGTARSDRSRRQDTVTFTETGTPGGNTDSQPITGRYASNWELSGARAASVVRVFVGDGVPERRVSLTGYAAQHPVASNATATGRARNRRVEVVLTRIHTDAAGTRS